MLFLRSMVLPLKIFRIWKHRIISRMQEVPCNWESGVKQFCNAIFVKFYHQNYRSWYDNRADSEMDNTWLSLSTFILSSARTKENLFHREDFSFNKDSKSYSLLPIELENNFNDIFYIFHSHFWLNEIWRDKHGVKYGLSLFIVPPEKAISWKCNTKIWSKI